MSESEHNSQSEFMIERIKARPINKKKLIRRTLTTAAMAVIFGLIACFTFLVLEPVISNLLYPEEKPQEVRFPEDQEEMSPEEMLTDIMQQENQTNQTLPEGDVPPLEPEQVQQILESINLEKKNYQQLYKSLRDFIYVGEDVNGTVAISQYIVTIQGITSNTDWLNNVQQSSNQASGVIIANNGVELLILVDYTSLKNSESLVLDLSDGYYQINAQLKGLDTATNLAVIAVNLADIPEEWMEIGGLAVATLGSSSAKSIVGTPVIAVGSPMGSSGSLGYGMISAVSGQLTKTDTCYTLLQTDIYGSSKASGVLFDLEGRVIGMITTNESTSDMENVITAYGITELKSRIQKLSNEEEIAYLGIGGVTVPSQVYISQGVPRGVYINKVEMDSPTMLAGIQPGDILVKIGDEDILSFESYVNNLLQRSPNETVTLTIMRQSQEEYRELEFTVVLQKR